MYKDAERKTFGEYATEIYDDWDGIGTITKIPDFAPHRVVDKIVIKANGPTLKTAIICPPTIYGVGRGPGNHRGHQLYELARCTLERKQGFQVGAGKTCWPNIHIYDMSKCYLELVNAATQGGGKATWGEEVSTMLSSQLNFFSFVYKSSLPLEVLLRALSLSEGLRRGLSYIVS